jgi:hypothetical protein
LSSPLPLFTEFLRLRFDLTAIQKFDKEGTEFISPKLSIVDLYAAIFEQN